MVEREYGDTLEVRFRPHGSRKSTEMFHLQNIICPYCRTAFSATAVQVDFSGTIFCGCGEQYVLNLVGARIEDVGTNVVAAEHIS